jgi:hypothetical protein
MKETPLDTIPVDWKLEKIGACLQCNNQDMKNEICFVASLAANLHPQRDRMRGGKIAVKCSGVKLRKDSVAYCDYEIQEPVFYDQRGRNIDNPGEFIEKAA